MFLTVEYHFILIINYAFNFSIIFTVLAEIWQLSFDFLLDIIISVVGKFYFLFQTFQNQFLEVFTLLSVFFLTQNTRDCDLFSTGSFD